MSILLLKEIKLGDTLLVNVGLDCITSGSRCEVKTVGNALYVECKSGKHFLVDHLHIYGHLSMFEILGRELVTKLNVYDRGGMSTLCTKLLFQELIDDDIAWSLSGTYSFMADTLIKLGLCHIKKEDL